jgi:ElaB/YqjD/DUF883 family membrane-anchored ribosome-binding protein
MRKRKPRPTKQARGAASAAASGLQEVIDSAEDLLKDFAGQSGAAAEAMREKISATAEAARSRLADLAVDAADGARENAVEFVRNDPWRAVALAALTYIAASTLFSRGE